VSAFKVGDLVVAVGTAVYGHPEIEGAFGQVTGPEEREEIVSRRGERRMCTGYVAEFPAVRMEYRIAGELLRKVGPDDELPASMLKLGVNWRDCAWRPARVTT
jgi:hypothetical protein